MPADHAFRLVRSPSAPFAWARNRVAHRAAFRCSRSALGTRGRRNRDRHDAPSCGRATALGSSSDIAAGSEGQGFAQNAAQRRAIEKLAMARAVKHFKTMFTSVEDVCHEGRSYDIHCQQGRRELLVEVKGTTGDGSKVFLTRKEYELAKPGNSALYVLHSIRLNGKRATGGKKRVLSPWRVTRGKATPCLRLRVAGKIVVVLASKTA